MRRTGPTRATPWRPAWRHGPWRRSCLSRPWASRSGARESRLPHAVEPVGRALAGARTGRATRPVDAPAARALRVGRAPARSAGCAARAGARRDVVAVAGGAGVLRRAERDAGGRELAVHPVVVGARARARALAVTLVLRRVVDALAAEGARAVARAPAALRRPSASTVIDFAHGLGRAPL